MQTCANCGQESPDAFRFCPACAAPLGTPYATREVRKTVSVVFCDVTGSTSLGEHVDPESLRRLMSNYYERMREVLERHGGTVERLIGDAVMGVFGIPVLHEDDALRAVRAALQMREGLATLNEELERTWGVTLVTRTGINTGEVLAGLSAAEGFVMGGVTGDAVNVAARLEQAARPGEILIGDATHDLVRDSVEDEPIEALSLKGKDKPVAAFRLVGLALRAATRRMDSPMVGRDRQLAQLQQAFDGTVADLRCQLFTILGAAGAGKSRLVEEFLALTGDRCRSLVGRCLPYGEGITFWPVAEIVKQAAGITDQDSAGDATRRIAELVTEDEDASLITGRVAAVLGLGETAASNEETFWAVRRLLESLARRTPLVIEFDDIHWAESTFLDLIEHLADWSRDAPILLVSLARPEFLDGRPGWAGGKLNATTVLLEPLSERDSETLIGNLLGETALPHAVRERFTETAGGNPLFVEELLSMLVDDGRLRKDDGRWIASGDLAEIAIPPTISAVIAARLDRLPPPERASLERASVIGKIFYAGAVGNLTPESERGGVGSNLMNLVRKELVKPTRSDLAGEDAFGFRHILTRDVAYESTPKEVRAELHELAADWLEGVAGERRAEYEEILGYHLEQAHRYLVELGPADRRGEDLARRAAEALGAAGRRARSRMDAPAATNLLSRSIALLPQDDPLRLRLLPELGRALVDSGGFERAADVLSEAELLISTTEDPDLRSHTMLARLELDSFVSPDGWAERAEREARNAIDAFTSLGDEQGLALAWGLLGDSFALRCKSAEAADAAAHALEHARAAGEDESRYHSSHVIALFFGPTPVGEAIARCEELLAREGIGRAAHSTTLWSLGGLRAMEGDFDEGRRLVLEGAAMDRDLGRELIAAVGPAEMLGRIEMLAGDPAAAERELRKGFEVLDRLGDKNFLPTIAAMLARALCGLDRADEAARFTEVSERTAGHDDVASQVLWRAARAGVLSRQGRIEEAVAIAHEAASLVRTTDYIWLQGDVLLDLAEAEIGAGRAPEAAVALREAMDLFERKGNTVSAGRARERLDGLGD